ncbi:hypothetical protein N8455_00795, partial [Candidatus Gracilibacteria bacterium]|nr:hypothetical protein [Candidatus Gracilibacteria bacterium]
MTQVNKIKKGVYLFESEEHLTKVLFSENKVWMNKKELSKLFGRKKTEINSMISKIFVEGEFDISDHINQSYNSTL